MCFKRIKIGTGNIITNSFNTTWKFFGGKKDIEELKNLLESHTKGIFSPVNNTINGEKIDRADYLNKIKTSSANVIFVVGNPGVGKTALFKDFYEKENSESIIYAFKGSEFNLENINILFERTGFTLYDFSQVIQKKKPYIIIDSAEQILDIKNTQPFIEFVTKVKEYGGKIIFTCRSYYIDNLKYALSNLLGNTVEYLHITNLHEDQVVKFLGEKSLIIPSDKKLLKLLETPFYLDIYASLGKKTDITISDFREEIRNKKIGYSHQEATCFIQIAIDRAVGMTYFVSGNAYDGAVLQSLEGKGVIFSDPTNGYAISYDIYEEWGLVKHIDQEYGKSTDISTFFSNLSNNLSIRRAFRNRLSERLELGTDSVKEIFDYILGNNNIPEIWKDETIIAILYSDFGIDFLNKWKNEIIADKRKILNKIIILTKIAGKTPDLHLIKQIFPEKDLSFHYTDTIFLRANGKIRNSLVKFIFDNKEIIYPTVDVISILDEYTSSHKTGDTAKYAGLTAIHYLNQAESEKAKHGIILGIEKQIDPLSRVCLRVASEIKDELKVLLEKFINEFNKQDRTDRTPFYTIAKFAITDLYTFTEVVNALPTEIMKVFDKFCYSGKVRTDNHYSEVVDNSFGMDRSYDFTYFPSSALQTPIYRLLKANFEETLNFIIEFVNKTVDFYSKSELDGTIETLILTIDGKEYVYSTSPRLYGLYRGFVPAPHSLESMHMALEKYLLEIAKTTEKKVLSKICKDILKNTNSISLVAIIVSLVKSCPNKLDDIILILMQNKKIFDFDIRNYGSDLSIQSTYGIPLGLGDTKSEVYSKERINTCSDEHRKFKFEDIIRHLQFFKSDSDAEFEQRRDDIFSIIDTHFEMLKKNPDETWEIMLNRTDIRKLDIVAEKYDEEKIQISFKPKDQEIIEKSSKSLEHYDKTMKYLNLLNWTRAKLNGQDTSKYTLYQGKPFSILDELKEFLAISDPNQDIKIIYRDLPLNVSFLLLRDSFQELLEEDRTLCRQITINYALKFLENISQRVERNYQMGDELVFYSLILLYRLDSSDLIIKKLIVEIVLNSSNEVCGKLAQYISVALREFDENFSNGIFWCFIYLKNKLENKKNEFREDVIDLGKPYRECTMKEIIEDYQSCINDCVAGKYDSYKIESFQGISYRILVYAFSMIKSGDSNSIKLVDMLLDIIAKDMFEDTRQFQKDSYSSSSNFMKRLVSYILFLKKTEDASVILNRIIPFLNDKSEASKDLFTEFVSAQDKFSSETYDMFWFIREKLFYPKVIEVVQSGKGYYLPSFISNYLFAWDYRKKTAKNRHSLKIGNQHFFANIVKNIGTNGHVLYSLTKLLDDIGTEVLFAQGVFWFSDILMETKNLNVDPFDVVKNDVIINNTIYYMENYMRKYIFLKKKQIRDDLKLKNRVIVILDFMIKHSSATGYILRDNL